MRAYKTVSVATRLWKHISPEPNSGCWLWTASCPHGYGGITVNGKTARAHRISYTEFVGEIPFGLCVLHKCDVKICVNPSHLFLGTRADNNADMVSKGRHRSAKITRCPRDHPYSGENLAITSDGGRRCRRCERARQDRRYRNLTKGAHIAQKARKK